MAWWFGDVNPGSRGDSQTSSEMVTFRINQGLTSKSQKLIEIVDGAD